MKALLSKAVGGPETLVLDEVPDPAPGPGEVVIAVKACGVNFPDVLIIKDLYQNRPPRPFSPGGEVSGVIVAIGEGVSHLRPGQRVLAYNGWGGMAERVAIDVARVTPIPDAMAFDVAAAFVMTYATAYHGLKDRARLRAGESVLVLGAAGGVGLACVEVAKAMGARVIAAASTVEKTALAEAHGADATLVYPPGPFDKDAQRELSALFKTACGLGGADVICDVVGGDYAEAALRAIAWEGQFLVLGFPAGIPRIPLNLPLLKSCDIVGVAWGAAAQRDPDAHQRNVAELLAICQAAKLSPHISEHYPLAEAPEAISRLERRQAMGKIVVMIGD